MMENFLSTRIIRDPLITGVYNCFVVDVLDEDATYRGYVCAVDSDHCMVRIGSMQQVRRVPMEKLRLVEWMETIRVHPDDVSDEIDVLVSVEDNQPESWQPARIISGMSFDSFALVDVEVTLPMKGIKRYYVLDSSNAVFKRIRSRGVLGNPVTAHSFSYQEIPVSEFTSYCDNFAGNLQKVREISRFHSRLMQEAGYGLLMFLSATDDHIALLVASDYNQIVMDPKTKMKVMERIAFSVDGFMQKLNLATEKIAGTVLNELVTQVAADLDLSDSREFVFEHLLVELSMEVFSFLDIYDQHQLRRTCKSFHRRLSRKTLRQCVILPNQNKHVIESLKIDLCKNTVRNLAYIIGNTISQDAKILYFFGNWDECLFTLAHVLMIMDVKLDWLVIANNSTLLLNEFLPFPKWSPMLCTDDFTNFYGNYSHPEKADTICALICRHIALKNCCFDSRLSFCFKEILSREKEWSEWVIGPGRRSLRCCSDPFSIVIPRWRYCFTETATATFEASFRSALEDHCPALKKRMIENLARWLNSLTSEACEPRRCIWPFIALSYEMWKESPPKCLDDVKADISQKK
ncbi:uncharacterized protein LOC129589669 isoform X2 [Paramacrobiotus metropolitanus]|uniref:uncharacterized protein LOC129589669 isoform X2 n=1 Tax=Paramacrobiotus metropolitanus TaxID=2943436 RepID=UPI002445B386|nr:uncharacterized protein LOC129589669 isoform X2 [Paramacrobiotus metropolitanus]